MKIKKTQKVLRITLLLFYLHCVFTNSYASSNELKGYIQHSQIENNSSTLEENTKNLRIAVADLFEKHRTMSEQLKIIEDRINSLYEITIVDHKQKSGTTETVPDEEDQKNKKRKLNNKKRENSNDQCGN